MAELLPIRIVTIRDATNSPVRWEILLIFLVFCAERGSHRPLLGQDEDVGGVRDAVNHRLAHRALRLARVGADRQSPTSTTYRHTLKQECARRRTPAGHFAHQERAGGPLLRRVRTFCCSCVVADSRRQAFSIGGLSTAVGRIVQNIETRIE